MIQLQHPEGKKGAKIRLDKYETVKAENLAAIRQSSGILYKQLTKEIHKRLEGKFDGAITWYVTAVKLDLEARNLIERYQADRQQHLKMVED